MPKSYEEFKDAMIRSESSGSMRIVNGRGYVGLWIIGESANIHD